MRFLCTPHFLFFLFELLPTFIPLSDVTSEASVITFNVYDRAVSDQGFLGTVQIKPVLIHDHTVDQWYKYVSLSLHLTPTWLSNFPSDHSHSTQTQAF